MKAFGSTVFIFYFLAIVSFAWSLPLDESNHAQDIFKAQFGCLNGFSAKVNSITDKIKNSSESCLKAADLRFQVFEKVKLIQALSKKCNLEPNAKDYFECVKNIADNSRKILNEIDLITDFHSKNVESIQQKKQNCLARFSEEGKFEIAKARNDLNVCLKDIPQPHSGNPKQTAPVKSSPPEDMDKFLQKLDMVKDKYESLRECTLAGDYDSCWAESNLGTTYSSDENMSLQMNLIEYLNGNSSDYFSEITELDQAMDTCIRQYITMQLNPDYNYFDLESCLKLGHSAIEVSEDNFENNKKLIENLIEIEEEFKKCRQITKELDTPKCVSQILMKNMLIKELQQKIAIKSDNSFSKQRELIRFLYNDDYPCIDDLYSMLRFSGLDLNGVGRSVVLDCFLKGREGRDHPPSSKDEVLTDLQGIQEYLKDCSLHPESPGFGMCFKNAFWTNRGVLFYINVRFENINEIVEQSDNDNHTCFGGILKASRSFSELEKLEKCILDTN